VSRWVDCVSDFTDVLIWVRYDGRMMFVVDNENARATVFEHIQTIESYPDFGEPTPQMMADHGHAADQMMAVSHQTNRGIRELAEALDIPRNKFEAFFARKSVLNVGCGEGILDRQLARNRKTAVTALDHDPAMLAKVPIMPNLRTIEGSGYDLQSAIGSEEFDIVMVAFSSLLWARNVREIRRSIDSALLACKLGGTAVFIPLVQHPRSHEAYRAALAEGRIPGYAHRQVAPESVERVANIMRMEGWMRSARLRAFEAAEKSGSVACAYAASAFNKNRVPVNRMLGPEHPYEDYSVVATVLEK